MTRMKTRKSNLEIVETNSVVTNLKKILTIGPWARAASGERLDQLLDVMLEKTTIQKHLIAAASETVAGASLAHRLHQANGAGGSMMNSLINFSSHCVVATNTAIKFSRSIKDVTLCFQTAILSRLSKVTIIQSWLTLRMYGCPDVWDLKPPRSGWAPLFGHWWFLGRGSRRRRGCCGLPGTGRVNYCG